MDELRLKLLWSNLFGLRFMLTIMPQNGYLYEKEFTEASRMAEKILGLDASAPTVPHTDTPENNIVSIISSGIPFLFLRVVDNLEILGRVITPYTVLVLPRIWATFCSIVCDVYVYKVARNCGYDAKEACTAMVIFASSYVTWVYFTRTFSTVFEAIAFVLILHIITKNLEVGDGRSDKVVNLGEEQVFQNAFQIGSLLFIGSCANLFFVAFVLYPILIWVWKPTGSLCTVAAMKAVLRRIVFLLTGIFITGTAAITCNNMFCHQGDIITVDLYKAAIWPYETLCDLMNSNDAELEPFTNIPKNIIGIIVKLLVLFGPLALQFCRNSRAGNAAITLLADGVWIILATYMLVRIQSPVFLVPLLIPIAILSAKFKSVGKVNIVLWCMFNFTAFSFYGVDMQGGVIPSMQFLNTMARIHSQIALRPKDLTISAVFYETPMPPQYLTAWYNHPYTEGDYGEIAQQKHASIHMLRANSHTLVKTLDSLLVHAETTVFLIIPGSLPCEMFMRLNRMYNLELYNKFFPHFSNLSPEEIMNILDEKEWCSSQLAPNHDHIPTLLYDKLSLNFFKVEKLEVESKPDIAKQVEGVKVLLNNYSSSI